MSKIKNYLRKRSSLDIFLIKSGVLVIAYFLLRLFISTVPFMEPFFVFFKRIMAAILLKTSYFIVHVLGYEANVYRRIIWIEGSEGVKIINACMAWPVMALFAGFIIIYPGDKRSKYWFIPSGIVAIIIMNVLRITAMTIISYEAPHTLDAYHRYVFNLVLYVVVFSLWAVWVRKFGRK